MAVWIIVGIVASVFGVVAFLLDYPRRAMSWLLARLGYTDEPRLVVRLLADPDRASEPFLQWAHIEIENVGKRRRGSGPVRAARDVHVRIAICSVEEPHTWSTHDNGPQTRVDLHRDEAMYVPVALRSLVPIDNMYGNRVAWDICYVTDVNFLTQRHANRTVEAGRHPVEIAISHGGNRAERKRAWFDVPNPKRGSLRLCWRDNSFGLEPRRWFWQRAKEAE